MAQQLNHIEQAERAELSIELEGLKYYWEQAREYADGEHENADLARGAIINLRRELAMLERRFWEDAK